MGEHGVQGLREECLSAAAHQLLSYIHPTLDSEEERRDIIDYAVRLIKSHHNCEVFPYGSVPLKTYLPDGDIDLTAINADDSVAYDVFALLKMEEKNLISEFKVKDTQFIDAEVKIVKCLVQNTVIDISFNQLGGLSALCFLEQVDRLVGRNHLFKRSIILIKAWCYYESRILGAHHGLISTYCLETLVLYIFQLYNSSLCGPLEVLYRFLDYYSKFDWENYCISLKGPVCKSSLPHIVVKVPENGWTNLMFSEEFLENCVEMFSLSYRVLEGRPIAFPLKNLNIIDPLKENNNLGRSVHIGNFYRIKSAFKYGARKLGQVLSLPCEKIAYEIHKFFSNTVAMHGHNTRNSILQLALKFDGDSLTASMSLPAKFFSKDDNDGFELESKNQTGLPLKRGSECWYTTSVDSGHLIAVETYDVNLSCSNLRNCRLSSPYHAPHVYYSTPLSWNDCHQTFCFSLSAENGSFEDGKFVNDDVVDSASQPWLVDDRYQGHVDVTSLDFKDLSMGDSEALNPLADLSGDYDSHIRSLLYGQLCNGFSPSAVAHLPPFWWLPLTMQSTCSEQSRAAHSASLSYVYCSEAQGSGSYLSHAHGVRHPQGGSSNKASDCVDHINRHVQSDGSCTASGAKSKDNDGDELLLEKGGKHPSPCPVGNTDDNSGGPWRIEFGSIGNLAEEVLSASANMRRATEEQGETAMMKQERSVARQMIHLKSEAEFPPLGL